MKRERDEDEGDRITIRGPSSSSSSSTTETTTTTTTIPGNSGHDLRLPVSLGL